MDVIEFFSGIGGMRLALTDATASLEKTFPLRSFKAIDTSELVNQVYRHNFNGEDPWKVNIETIKLKDLDGKGKIWTMSPPCQPFTTTKDSKQLHSQDPRNKAFVHIMKSLEAMTDRPDFIFLENVKGFCHSEAHTEWTEVLARCGYSWRQYLLTPFHFRVPNNRMRFYMVIRKDSCRAQLEVASDDCDGFNKDKSVVFNDIRPCGCDGMHVCTLNGKALDSSFLHLDSSMLHKLHEMGEDEITGPPGVNDISQYLIPREGIDDAEFRDLLVGDDTLQKRWAQGLSFVGADDRCTFCFTSSYGQSYNRASGSLYHMLCSRGKRVEKQADMSLLHSGAVRLFSPCELLHLFGFPDTYTFPAGMTTRHKYRAIGQSINKIVVQMLMHSELCRHHHADTVTATELSKRRVPEGETGGSEETDEGRRCKKAKEADILVS